MKVLFPVLTVTHYSQDSNELSVGKEDADSWKSILGRFMFSLIKKGWKTECRGSDFNGSKNTYAL